MDQPIRIVYALSTADLDAQLLDDGDIQSVASHSDSVLHAPAIDTPRERSVSPQQCADNSSVNSSDEEDALSDETIQSHASDSFTCVAGDDCVRSGIYSVKKLPNSELELYMLDTSLLAACDSLNKLTLSLQHTSAPVNSYHKLL